MDMRFVAAPSRLCIARAAANTRQRCQTPALSSTEKATPRDATRRCILSIGASLSAAAVLPRPSSAAEQGIQPSDYTVPAKGTSEYVERIANVRKRAWAEMRALAGESKYTELSNSLVLGPVDDVRQSVLYLPAALLKEGKRQEAINSRKAYTDYMRELKRLDEISQKAARFDADDEDVLESIDRLSKRLDDVLRTTS